MKRMNIKRDALAALAGVAMGAVVCLSSPSYAAQAAGAFMSATRYNSNHQVTGVIQPSADGSSVHLATRNVYDTHGRLARVEKGSLSQWLDETVDPANWASYFTLFEATISTYDDSGRRLTSARAGADGTVYTLTQFSYDAYDQVTCKTERMNPATFAALPADGCALSTPTGPNGYDRITHFTYDGLGATLTEVRAYGTSDVQNYRTNVYDGSSRLGDSTDANGNHTHMTYDALSRLSAMYFPSPTTAGQYNSADYEQYGYDGNGNRTSLRKRDGRTITYDFDALNRVVDEIYPASTISNVYYGYDLRNLQLYSRFGSVAGAGVTTTYDGYGNVSTASSNQSGVVRTLSHLYDAEGHRLRITHPDGSYFTYAYDGLNRLGTIRESGATTLLTVGYDTHGRRQSQARGASVSNSSYGYDAISRLQTMSNDLAGTAYDDTRTFGYNPADQVISRNLSNTLYAYTQAPTNTTNYSVNGLNEYTSLTAVGGSPGTATTSYDADGNMTSDGATTFGYDILNRMVSAVGGKSASLTYDPKGRLFQTTGASGTTQFLYDGDSLVAEYNASGTLLRRYVHGSGVDVPAVAYEGATVSATNRRYFHVDHQGSVVALADTNGNGLQPYTYDSYGVPSTGNGSGVFARFQYTGQITLPDLGLYYYKARIYNPTLGRFMQTDPVGYKPDMDLYTYVVDDPLNLTDASGNTPESWVYVGADIAMLAAGASSPGEAAFNVIVDTLLGFEPVPGASTAFHAAEGVIKVRAGVKVAEKIVAKSSRAGKEFSESERAAAKAKSAEENAGKMTCKDCNKTVENVANEKGVTPPDNQAHVHHDPPISEGGGKDSTPVVLCRICHILRHIFERKIEL